MRRSPQNRLILALICFGGIFAGVYVLGGKCPGIHVQGGLCPRTDDIYKLKVIRSSDISKRGDIFMVSKIKII